MKRLAQILLILAAGITLLFAAWYWFPDIRDRSRIQRAYELAVRPATDWVRDFHQQHGRLPTTTELQDCSKTNWPNYGFWIYDSQPDWQHSWGRLGVDFVLCVHDGEWNLFRQSWDGREWKVWTD